MRPRGFVLVVLLAGCVILRAFERTGIRSSGGSLVARPGWSSAG